MIICKKLFLRVRILRTNCPCTEKIVLNYTGFINCMSAKVCHLQMEISVGGLNFSLWKIPHIMSFFHKYTRICPSFPSFFLEGSAFSHFFYFTTLSETGGGNKHFLPCFSCLRKWNHMWYIYFYKHLLCSCDVLPPWQTWLIVIWTL